MRGSLPPLCSLSERTCPILEMSFIPETFGQNQPFSTSIRHLKNRSLDFTDTDRVRMYSSLRSMNFQKQRHWRYPRHSGLNRGRAGLDAPAVCTNATSAFGTSAKNGEV
jgi:hypothetical protein